MTEPPRPPASPVSIRLGNDGYHLFRHFAPALMTLRPIDAEGRTDLIVFACNKPLDAAEGPDRLPAHAWDDAARGGTRIVFDASGEGKPHDPATSEQMHGLLARRGVPFDHAVYLTQDRQYGADYAAWCAAQGIGRRIKVINYDYWIRHLMRSVEDQGERIFAKRARIFRRRPRRRDRRFLALTYTPRPTKVLFLLQLLRSGRWDDGFVSFGGFEQLARHRNRLVAHFEKDLRALAGFEDLAAKLLPWMPELQGKGEVAFGAAPDRSLGQFLKRLPQDATLDEYNRSWFSVITETEMLNRPCRITEKPLKAMLNFHPAIILGNPGSLPFLRNLGFSTFEGFFDERYDEEPDARRRYKMVWREVDRLCRMDEAELDRLEGALAETLTFNASWGLTRLPAIWRDEVDARLLDAALTPGPDVDVVQDL